MPSQPPRLHPRTPSQVWRAGRGLTLAGAAIALLVGCGTRGNIAVIEAPVAGANVQQVIVATSRGAVPAPMFFNNDRDFTTSFARFAVSVPPDREPGKIRYPKDTPNPQTDFVVTDAKMLDGANGFVAEVNAAAAALPRDKRIGSVFVHGFNMNFAEALIKNVQLKQDLASPGLDILFSWPSEAHLFAYETDRENALFTREAMADTLKLMSRTTLNGYNLVAHSMGTFATMETLRSLALARDQATLDKINAVVLISADLEVDVFRRQAPPVLAAGVPILLLVANDDKALKLSAVLRGESKRVGTVSTREELGNLDVSIIDLSDIDSKGDGGHLKVGSSPELIEFIRRIRDSGVSIFEDNQKVGLFDRGAVLLQTATGIVVNVGR